MTLAKLKRQPTKTLQKMPRGVMAAQRQHRYVPTRIQLEAAVALEILKKRKRAR